ncbi:VOC family protein [Anaerovorax sp. IOR16]|uniref:VOC family protein n=1 Tax=Anaerovorax sp. IOR16 TaxID=2773458 RepID=UPI0019D2604D|nr:VOC family protein [Anaerovorax sp. IOR16]
MEARINLITIWTDDVIPMKEFYNKVLGFKIENDLGEYVEFKNEGVRFALCLRKVMYNYSGEYKKLRIGQSFELAFPCKSPEDVDKSYKDIISKGGVPVHEPQNMPWNQRTALFSDPDGNIHEIFSDFK